MSFDSITEFALQLSKCNHVPPSSDAASEQGAGLVPGPSCSCLTSSAQESDDLFGGGADHRGTVGRHGQLEGPRLEICNTGTSHSKPRRPARCSHDGRHIQCKCHAGREILTSANVQTLRLITKNVPLRTVSSNNNYSTPVYKYGTRN